MQRGEVWWVDFDPIVRSEIVKRRPAVIVSNDFANKTQSRVQVVPLTRSIGRVYSWEIVVVLRGVQSKACTDQIKTVSKERFGPKLGALSGPELDAIGRALRLQLGLQ